MKQDAERLLAGELSYLDYAAACAAEDARCADLVSDAPYWAMLQRARDEGKKIIYVSGPAPVELIYAFDCVPMSFDLLTPRLSENAALIPPLMRACELRANADVCRLSKAQIGTILVGDMGLRPDAYVAVPIPCDSACMAYMALAARVGAPTFQFDVPKRPGGRTLAYLAAQYDAFVAFLEKLTGKKLDQDALRARMALTNRAAALLAENAALRSARPCPLPSALNICNELTNAWGPTEEFCAQLEAEGALGKKRAAAGEGYCPGVERHRVVLLHNMLWRGLDYAAFLAEKYASAVVADGYSFGARAVFEHPEDPDACRETACRRLLDGATVHGTGANGQEMVDEVCRIITERDADVAIFMGSSGCRHEWAAARMLEETVQQRCGISMFSLDTDNTDPNYRGENEVRQALAEYMETVVR